VLNSLLSRHTIRNYTSHKNAIEKAEEACQNSGQAVADHFVHVGGMIEVGKGARRKVDDVHLTRYACYLLVENADPSKPIVALGQAYFAVQTRRQEIEDELALRDRIDKLTIWTVCYTYSSGRISMYLRNHSIAFSQYAIH
jgi:hypothetical protein